jgi:hypothetical protein
MPDLDHLFVVGAVEGQEFKSLLSVRPRPLVKLHGGLSEYDYDDKKTICNLDLNRYSSD